MVAASKYEREKKPNRQYLALFSVTYYLSHYSVFTNSYCERIHMWNMCRIFTRSSVCVLSEKKQHLKFADNSFVHTHTNHIFSKQPMLLVQCQGIAHSPYNTSCAHVYAIEFWLQMLIHLSKWFTAIEWNRKSHTPNFIPSYSIRMQLINAWAAKPNMFRCIFLQCKFSTWTF